MRKKNYAVAIAGFLVGSILAVMVFVFGYLYFVIGLQMCIRDSTVLREFEDVAVGEHGDVVCGNAHVVGEFGMQIQHPVFAVCRDEEARTRQRDDLSQFIATRVSGSMDFRKRLVNNISAFHEELVDHAVDRLFVSRNHARRKDNRVPRDKMCIRDSL